MHYPCVAFAGDGTANEFLNRSFISMPRIMIVNRMNIYDESAKRIANRYAMLLVIKLYVKNACARHLSRQQRAELTYRRPGINVVDPPKGSSRRGLWHQVAWCRRWRVLLIAALVLVGPVYQQVTQRLDRISQSPPGRTVLVDGVATHVHCTGTGSPTVVLQAGAVGFAQSWAWVQAELSKVTRTCSYDRPGLGWSEASKSHYTGIATAQHLHQLLHQIREPPPYVLIGHSMGGPLVQIFTGLYPDQVLAIGLVDPTHPDVLTRYPNEAKPQKAKFSALIRAASVLTYSGLIRGTNLLAHKAEGLPSDAYQAAKLFVSSPQHLSAAHRELMHWDITMAAARAFMQMGGRPLTVISATESTGNMPEHYLEPLQGLHAEMAATSSDSRHLKIPHANHFTLLTKSEQAKKTAYALEDLVERARAKLPVYHYDWYEKASGSTALAQR